MSEVVENFGGFVHKNTGKKSTKNKNKSAQMIMQTDDDYLNTAAENVVCLFKDLIDGDSKINNKFYNDAIKFDEFMYKYAVEKIIPNILPYIQSIKIQDEQKLLCANDDMYVYLTSACYDHRTFWLEFVFNSVVDIDTNGPCKNMRIPVYITSIKIKTENDDKHRVVSIEDSRLIEKSFSEFEFGTYNGVSSTFNKHRLLPKNVSYDMFTKVIKSFSKINTSK